MSFIFENLSQVKLKFEGGLVMKWICKKNFKRCLAVSLAFALMSPVNITEGVFAANTAGTADEEYVQVDEALHMHTFACYEGYTLECADADEDHVHGIECYTYPEDAELSCSLEEGTEHIHNEDGFYCTETMARVLNCGKEEHVHSEECYDENQTGNPEGTITPEPTASESPTASPSPIESPDGEPTPSEEPTQEPSASPGEDGGEPEKTPGPVPGETPDATLEPTPVETLKPEPEVTSEPEEEPEKTPEDTEDPGESDSQGPDAGEDNEQTNDNEEQGEGAEEDRISMDVPIPLNENPGLVVDLEGGNTSSASSDMADGATDHTGNDDVQDSDVNTEDSDEKEDENLSDTEEKQEPICGMEEHMHSDDCYIVIYACRKAEAETTYEYAWNWVDEKAQELESMPGDDADLHTMEYDSSKEWTMTLIEPKQRMTVSLLEENYLPDQIEAVRLKIVEGEDGEEVQETKEIMNVTWEVESGEFKSGAKEGNVVTLKAVQDVTVEDEVDEPTDLAEDAGEVEGEEKIDFEMLPDIRMDVLVAYAAGRVSDEEGLREAINSKQPVIILEDSFKVESGFNIDYTLTLYLNGCTLTYNGTQALFTVEESGAFTIKDAADGEGDDAVASINPQFGGGAGLWGNRAVLLGKQVSLFSANTGIESSGTEGKITGSGSLTAPIVVNSGGTLNIVEGTISFPGSRHGIFADNGTVNVSGGRITGNGQTTSGQNTADSRGGGIYGKESTLTISDGIIDNNKAYARGGGVYAENGSLTITGGTINNNAASVNGGGVFAEKATVTICGGEIGNNTAKRNGGGIYVLNGRLTVSEEADINENTAWKSGGGILLSGSEVTCGIEGGSISNNTIDGKMDGENDSEKNFYGAGVCGDPQYNIKVKMSGGNVSGNKIKVTENIIGMELNGGGIYASIVELTGGTISNNKIESLSESYEIGNGGGIYLNMSAGGTSFIKGGKIEKNTANNGGGIYFLEGALDVSGGEIYKNAAQGNYDKAVNCGGGGIFAGGNLTISAGKIIENEANCSGGGIEVCGRNTSFNHAGTLIMTGGEIAGNIAKEHEGGGIRVDSKENNIITGGSVTGNKTNTTFDWGGGGIFVNSAANLTIENALVTKNNAGGYGGGVGGCTSSTINILTLNGPAIYENTAKGSSLQENENKEVKIPDEYKSEFEKYSQDYFGNQFSTVYGVMLGGGSANWWGIADGKTVSKIGRNSYISAERFMGLNANPSAQDKAAALTSKTVEISGNESRTNGGGIMCNGTLTMGKGENDTEWYLPAQKVYEDKNGKALQLEGGEFEFWLLKDYQIEGDKVIFDQDNQAAPVAYNDENGYVIFKPYSQTAGTHTFYMAEKSDDDSKITYDNRVYKIEVELEDVTTVQRRNVSALTSKIQKIEIVFPEKDKGIVTGETVTFTNTEEPEPSPSGKPTNTPTATSSATPTATPGVRPSATPISTPGIRPSATPISTPGVRPSATPTATSGVRPSATPTSTPGVTPSATPTASTSASPSASATPTASTSASPSASATPTPTDQSRIMPTATPTASASASPSATVTPTPTERSRIIPTATPTASATASPSESATPAVSTSASPSASASTIPSATPAASASAAPTPAATPDPRIPDSPDIITIDDDGVPRTYVKVWDSEEEDWTYISEDDVPRALPDPNESDSPDKITILDEEVPKTYIKVPDPDEEDEFVYILDDDVPLGAPKTADASTILLWGGLCLTSMQGIIVLWPRKKSKREEDKE